MDTISGGDVFNGKMNVYWQFVYGLYPARRRMWQNREAAGTWNADAYLALATGRQNYLPERVFNQDYWYKYLRPYEKSGDASYIHMLEGGRKNHQREGFVRNNLTYMASQYMGIYCTSDSITVRAYTPGKSDDMTPEQAAIIERTIEAVPPNPVIQVMLYNKGYVVVEVASVMKRIKAEKGVYKTVDFRESSQNMGDTVINIHGASNVRAIGDMSSLYIKFCNFSKASRLRSLQIGSDTVGYTNLGLESVSFGSNPMLEELYIQNCPNSTTTLDLSGCQALKNLDVRGSGFTGISFATGGLIQEALLCSPASLNIRNLRYLDDDHLSLESYDNLTTLRFEETPNINALAMVEAATALSRVRIVGVDWTIYNTSVLNRLLTVKGLDESDNNTDMSVITGTAYISSSVRIREIEAYQAAWNNLTITYDPNNVVTQYLVSYVNYNGDTLYEMYVDRGSTLIDPYDEGLIDIPTKPSDEQYDYKFGYWDENDEYYSGSGWDDLSGYVLGPRTITAVYSSSYKTFTVTWYNRQGGTALQKQTCTYGGSLTYSGEMPTRTDEESSYTYSLFTGWDKSTGNVTDDMDVYAQWSREALPQAGTPSSAMSTTQIYGVGASGMAEEYFYDRDYFDITLGHDFEFSNVTSQVILENRYFDGSTHLAMNYKLFDASSPSFTLAIDYEFLSSTTAQGTLVSCYEPSGSVGFRLYYQSSNPYISWGDRSAKIGYTDSRNVLVLRHVKGSTTMYIYSFNNGTAEYYQENIYMTTLTATRSQQASAFLTFGAHLTTGGTYTDFAKGWIHWCKIWWDDLGDSNARELAAWPHEKLRMEYAGPRRYYLAESTSRCNTSWVAQNMLALSHRFYGGSNYKWDGSGMQQFLNNRFFNALPYEWQNAIKRVRIYSYSYDSSTGTYGTVQSIDKVYLASAREAGYTSSTFANEGEYINYFTNNISRIKFRGFIIENTTNVVYNTTDPIDDGYDIKEGDIWVKTNDSSAAYIYISPDTYNKHTRIGVLLNSNVIFTGTGGLWVRAFPWWLRTNSSGSYFYCVTQYGSFNSYYYNNYEGVVPCFSI